MKQLFLLSVLLLSCVVDATVHRIPASLKQHKKPHALGLKRDVKKFEEFKKKKHAIGHHFTAKKLTPIPGSFNIGDKVSPPENQLDCGDCYGFSVTKALRSELMLVGRDPGVLAFNFILNNCGPVQEFGCGGGDFNAGENFLQNLGPWLNAADPYTAVPGKCKKGLSVAGTAITWNVVGNGGVPTFQELAQVIYNGGKGHFPSIDVAVCGDFESYTGGIYSTSQCGAESLNHMVNLFGYNMETSIDASGNAVFNAQGQPENGDGYFFLRNNWGNSWGENGDMRIRYGVDAVANTAMYFDVLGSTPLPIPSPAPAAPSGFLCNDFSWLPWCKS